jgi:phosphoglycolate phosphatase-like HAD superfamily hydrolase
MLPRMSHAPVQNTSVSRLDLDPIEAVLFDLDGTLIEVDMERFIPVYLRRLANRLHLYAAPERTLHTLRHAIMVMLGAPPGDCSLEELLRSMLADQLKIPWEGYQAALAAFCRDDLAEFRPLVRPHPLARALVESCLARGWQVVLATNPVFPREVITARLAWGGVGRPAVPGDHQLRNQPPLQTAPRLFPRGSRHADAAAARLPDGRQRYLP